MNQLEGIDLSNSVRLCLTLLHSLWQVGLLAVLVWGIERVCRKASVECRYCLYVAALWVGIAAIPITYALVDVADQPRNIATSLPEFAKMAEHEQSPIANPAVEHSPMKLDQTAQSGSSGPQRASTNRNGSSVTSATGMAPNGWLQLAPWIVAVYAAGVALMLARLILAIVRANQLVARAQVYSDGPLVAILRSLAEKWSMQVVPALARAEEIAVPKLIGLVRPTILLPASAISGLSVAELEMILTHELAHARRYDMWVNLVQRLAESVLFFNPAIWFLSRRVNTLREYCCDEMTCRAHMASASEPRVRYASALLRVVELAKPVDAAKHDLVTIAATGKSPSEMRRRVARLFGEPLREPLHISRSGLVAILALTTLAVSSPLLWSNGESASQALERIEESAARADSAFAKQIVLELKKQCKAVYEMHDPNDTHVVGRTDDRVLRGLHLWGASPNAMQTLSKLTGLQELTFMATDLRTDAFDAIGNLHNLRRFTANNCQFAPVQMAALKNLTSLEHLELSFSILNESNEWRLQQLGALSAEEQVTFDALTTQYSDKAYIIQAALLTDRLMPHLSKLVKLKSIRFVNTFITSSAMQNLELLTEMESLEISPLALTPQAASRLQGMQSLRSLRHFDVDDGIVAELSKLKSLMELDIWSGDVTDVGVTDIATLSNLQRLGIRGSQLTERGLEELTRLTSLRYLDLSFAKSISSEAVDRFREKMPRCEVKFVAAQVRSDASSSTDAAKQPDALLIATVLDAVTGEPIPKFQALPGTGRMEGLGWQWQPHMVQEYQQGQLQWPPPGKRGYDLQVLRIESPGYQTFHTQPIKILRPGELPENLGPIKDSSGKEIQNVLLIRPGEPFKLNIRVQRDNGVSGRVLDLDGQPVADATLAVGTAARSVRVESGKILLDVDRPELPLRNRWEIPRNTMTDQDGRFSLATELAPAVVVIAHEKGFAAIEFNELKSSPLVKLQPWGRIEGQVLWGEVPGANETMTIHAHGGKRTSTLDLGLMINAFEQTTSNDQGRFGFEKVPPGRVQLSRATKNGSSLHMQLIPHIEVLAGEPTKVVFGGKGRPVMGKLVGRDRWDNVRVRIALRAPSISFLGPNDTTWSSYGAFLSSAAGANYVKNDIQVKADGTFHVEHVPPESFQLFVEELGDDGKRTNIGGSQFSIETMPGGQSDEPQNLGELKVRSNRAINSELPPTAEPTDQGALERSDKQTSGAVGAIQEKESSLKGDNLDSAKNLAEQKTVEKPDKDEQTKQNDLVVVMARHVLLMYGKEIVTWEELDKRIAVMPDPTSMRPSLFITRGAREAELDKSDTKEFWELRRKYKWYGHSQGGLSVQADYRYDRIKSAADLLPDPSLKVIGTVVNSDSKLIEGATILLITPVDESIPYKTYNIAIKNGRVYSRIEHIMTDSNAAGAFELYPPKDKKYYVAAMHPYWGFALVQNDQFQTRHEIKLMPWASMEGKFAAVPNKSQWAGFSTRIPAQDGWPEITFDQNFSDEKGKGEALKYRFTHVPPIHQTAISRGIEDDVNHMSNMLPGASVSLLPGEMRQIDFGPPGKELLKTIEEIP